MMNDVENEVKEQQAEDGSVNRVPELKQLSEDIDKATNTFINAALELESAIQQYQRAEAKLGGAVTTISKKVDTPPNMACGIRVETTAPLTIGISADNQWVCLFCCQS